MRLKIRENLKTANLNLKSYNKSAFSDFIFLGQYNNFMSFTMIDARESIETIKMPALRVFRDYSIVDLQLLIKYKNKNLSCLVKLLLQFILIQPTRL